MALHYYLLENGTDRYLLEDGASLYLTEDSVADALPNAPGRVYKSDYPYFKPRKPPYWTIENGDDEEELVAMMGIQSSV